MAGPKNKSKKTKVTLKKNKKGDETFISESPSQKFTTTRYNKSGKNTGVTRFSKEDKTGKGKSFSGKSKRIDINPNQQITESVDSYPFNKKGYKFESTSSTQKGNRKTSSKLVPNNKKTKGTIKQKSRYSL
tara:strand:+ start:1509 stop:1901 length:393 start_codon:yes stop_codon:yes gene_type:complete